MAFLQQKMISRYGSFDLTNISNNHNAQTFKSVKKSEKENFVELWVFEESFFEGKDEAIILFLYIIIIFYFSQSYLIL